MTKGRAGLALFGVALVVRVIPALVLSDESVIYPDSRHYLEIADHLVAGDGYVDGLGERANRLPAYTLFLAAHRALFGTSILPIQLSQAVLGALTCLLLAWLLGPFFGWRVAAAAAAVTAVYPLLAVTSALLLIETPLSFLLVLEIALLAKAAREGRPWMALGAGIAGGAAVMMQAGYALLFLFLLPPAGWAARRSRPAVILAAFAAGTMLLPGAWAARNRVVLGDFVPFSSRAGMTFHDSFQRGYLEGEEWEFEPDRGTLEETVYLEELQRKGSELAWKLPARSLRLALLKQKYFWNVIPNHPGYRNWRTALLTLPFLPVLALFLAGLVRLPGRRPEAMWLFVPILYTAAVHLVIIGSIRYRITVEPFLIAVAVVAAWDMARGWRARRSGGSPRTGSASPG